MRKSVVIAMINILPFFCKKDSTYLPLDISYFKSETIKIYGFQIQNNEEAKRVYEKLKNNYD
jgi:hypothetical protein